MLVDHALLHVRWYPLVELEVVLHVRWCPPVLLDVMLHVRWCPPELVGVLNRKIDVGLFFSNHRAFKSGL